MKIKTKELEGALLDWAVANATKAWEEAHKQFPTMTLDPTFSGVSIRQCASGWMGESRVACVLMPNNPMRQDPQIYSPSTNWSQGGVLLEEYPWALPYRSINRCHMGKFEACTPSRLPCNGPTPLIAAMRAIVAAELGGEVDVPDDIYQSLQK